MKIMNKAKTNAFTFIIETCLGFLATEGIIAVCLDQCLYFTDWNVIFISPNLSHLFYKTLH